MDKESVVASLARNKKIAVETMAGQRYIIERILHTNCLLYTSPSPRD
ncbi:hypothetical protein JMUB7543_28420 [Staphylococcus aureus]